MSRNLVRRLQEKGIAARAYSVEQIAHEEACRLLRDGDAAGFGYPIYGSDLPQPMKDFIRCLPVFEGKKCFVFCTQWLWSGDGARTGADFLKPKGFDVQWGEHFLMPNNVCIGAIPLPFTNDRSKLDPVLARASRRINRFADKIVSGRSYLWGFNLVSYLLGCMQRVPFRRMQEHIRDNMRVDPDRCTRCGYCAMLCPSGNLVFDGESLRTRNRCVYCMRCYNFCPESAITHRGRPHNLRRGVPYRGPVKAFDPEILRPTHTPNSVL